MMPEKRAESHVRCDRPNANDCKTAPVLVRKLRGNSPAFSCRMRRVKSKAYGNCTNSRHRDLSRCVGRWFSHFCVRYICQSVRAVMIATMCTCHRMRCAVWHTNRVAFYMAVTFFHGICSAIDRYSHVKIVRTLCARWNSMQPANACCRWCQRNHQSIIMLVSTVYVHCWGRHRQRDKINELRFYCIVSVSFKYCFRYRRMWIAMQKSHVHRWRTPVDAFADFLGDFVLFALQFICDCHISHTRLEAFKAPGMESFLHQHLFSIQLDWVCVSSVLEVQALKMNEFFIFG